MKPPVLDYRRPESLDEALDLLREHGDEAKALAGGQSLVPMLNLRLARPALLVDIKALGLDSVNRDDGELALGALVRHRTLERSPEVAAAAPLLTRVAPSIGHPAIRNRGTIGGSLAHSEPTAELSLAAVTLDARVDVISTRGSRVIPAGELPVGPFMSALEPDELLLGIRFPTSRAGERVAFAEIAQRTGDFALVAAACRVVVHEGTLVDASLGIAGAGPVPVRARAAEEILTGRPPSEDAIREAVAAAVAAIEPRSDTHASAAFRRELAAVMTTRVLREACGVDPREER